MSTCYCTAPATTGTLCTHHLGQLRKHLWAAPEILRELDITITGQDAQGGGGGAGGTPMAFNETASTRKDDLLLVLHSAAGAADPQLRHRFDESPADLIARALGHLDTLARSPHIHTIAQDLAYALEQAEHVMQPAAERIIYGPCECGVELTAPKGADVAWCRGCGGRHEVTAVKQWWDVQVRDYLDQATGTLRQITDWLQLEGYDISPRTVEKWPERRRNRLIGCVQEGAPTTYSYSQARGLAKKHSERRTRVLAS
ncbi:hypothetical protein [Kocuria sp. KH4]